MPYSVAMLTVCCLIFSPQPGLTFVGPIQNLLKLWKTYVGVTVNSFSWGSHADWAEAREAPPKVTRETRPSELEGFDFMLSARSLNLISDG